VAGRLHNDELAIDVPLVQTLVARERPAWSDLVVEPLDASGSTNALFRLGRDLLVRLPRQPAGSATIFKEARWLPRIAGALPVAVPEVVLVGWPGFGYPEHWSVVRWIDGDVPSVPSPEAGSGSSSDALATDLAGLLIALRGVPVPPRATSNPALRWYRGEPLADGDARTRRAVEDCRLIDDLSLDLDAAVRIWDHALTLPGAAEPSAPAWYHGDLLAENLLVRDKRLVAVLDFGGLAVGDPTVDLIVAWEALDARGRRVFRDAYPVDDNTWLRGRAWALSLALLTFPYYWRTMPGRCADRLVMARAVLADSEL
jgi:aminoglycoside phosphotransferase (APT) family kinase protein